MGNQQKYPQHQQNNKTSNIPMNTSKQNQRPSNNQYSKNMQQHMQQQSKKDHEVDFDSKKIGTQHIENKHWKMVRNGQTRSLLSQFQAGKITCYDTIVKVSDHTIVHEAIILDRHQLFKLCQVYGANWDQKDKNGVTSLMKACAMNRMFYVEKLLQKDVDLQLKDNRGMTALDYAQLYDNYEIYDLLKESME